MSASGRYCPQTDIFRKDELGGPYGRPLARLLLFSGVEGGELCAWRRRVMELEA